MGLKIFSEEWGVESHIGYPRGLTQRRRVSWVDLKTNGTYQRAVRNQDSSCCAHADFLPGVAWRKHIENCRCFWPFSHDSLSKHPAFTGCLAPLLWHFSPLGKKCCCQEECAYLKGIGLAWTQSCLWTRSRNTVSVCTEREFWKLSVALRGWWTIPEHTPACTGSCSSTSCYSSAFY